MTVLITGGAGFIGAALGRHLTQVHGQEVVAFDNLHEQVHGPHPNPPDSRVRLFAGDVTHADNVRTLLATVRPEILIHLAAETGTGQSLDEASRHASVNVLGTTRILDAFTNSGHIPRHIVLASSRAVYGEGRWRSSDGTVFYPAQRSQSDLSQHRWVPSPPSGTDPMPLPHDARTTEPRPTSIYAATKLAQEHVLGAWCIAKGTRLSVLRLQNVYGPGQSTGNPYTGVIAHFAQTAARGEPLDVYEDGEITRDFVYIDDVVSAISAAALRDSQQDLHLDIGSGTPVTIKAVAETVSQQLGAPAPLVSGRFRNGDVRSGWADIGQARQLLDWEPTWQFEDGMRSLAAWMQTSNPVR